MHGHMNVKFVMVCLIVTPSPTSYYSEGRCGVAVGIVARV